MNKDRFHFSRLLSGRRSLTVQEKESALRSILQQTAIEEAGQKSLFGKISFGMRAAAVALLIVVAIPVAVLLLQTPMEDEFQQKGGKKEVPLFSITCVGNNNDRSCHLGDRLVFKITPPSKQPYFAAFARYLKDGAVIWYFPSKPTEKSRAYGNGNKAGFLSEGIEIGRDHRIGKYQVFGIFSSSSMTRDTIKQLFDDRFEIKKSESKVSTVFFSVEP